MVKKMKLTCWDYNGTIADYAGKVRPHLPEVLTALRASGHKNVVTTTLASISIFVI